LKRTFFQRFFVQKNNFFIIISSFGYFGYIMIEESANEEV